jgi:SOS-response transcriptional repressor LexA
VERLFVERMDQNEEIFVRYMNDLPFRDVVSAWMASEAYRRLRAERGDAVSPTSRQLPSRLRVVEGNPSERYRTSVPLVPLKAAAGAFSDPQHIADDGFEWVAVESNHRLRRGMFVAQIIGRSMEPGIPDGSYCLFRAPVDGTRQGKIVLVRLRDGADPETGERYTVKRYESEKLRTGDSWRHERIVLKPINPDFDPIVVTGKDQGELQVIAELVEVLGAVA